MAFTVPTITAQVVLAKGNPMALRVTLSEARRITKLSQFDLDDLADVSRGTVADIERGRNRNPSHETVTRLVRALQQRGLAGITAEELFPVPALVGTKKRASA